MAIIGCAFIQPPLSKEAQSSLTIAHLFLQEKYQSFIFFDATLRADEKERFVYAVFYEEPNIISYPADYKIVAVSKNGGNISELELPPTSPYWIKGKK